MDGFSWLPDQSDGQRPAALGLPLLHTQSLLTQTTQTAACNRHHSLNQQFNRWHLLSFERLCGTETVMMHKLIAKMLAITSQDVTASATALGATGGIAYRDGHTSLLDRAVMEKTGCECCQVVKRECDPLLLPAPRTNC